MKKIGNEKEKHLIVHLEDLEKKEKDILEKLTSVLNEELMHEDKIRKLDEDIDAIRQKESKIKVEFERQMDEIRQNAKIIMDQHV